MANQRKDLEAEYLYGFKSAAEDLCCPIQRGYGANNRFDPSFGLTGQQRFQFGDLRVNLEDRIVIVEVESSGGLTNLVKYWPLAKGKTLPILLLHIFAQKSAHDYRSHLHLWDFTWCEMRKQLWRRDRPKLFARKYTFSPNAPSDLTEAVNDFRECLRKPLPIVWRTVFGYEISQSN